MSEIPNISHLYCDDNGCWQIQSNDDHCNATAEFAATFASEFGMGGWGHILGILHDRGKEHEGFQCHIKQSSGYDTSCRSTDASGHSSAGAILAHRLKSDVLYWLSNPIAGHHRGLYDIDDLEHIVKGEMPSGVNTSLPAPCFDMPSSKPSEAEASHIARMLFSCLVDADRLDTERFMSPDKFAMRRSYDGMQSLKDRLDAFRRSLSQRKASPLNALRNTIQQMCEDRALNKPGFFSLTVPTGGGKTIASVIWAVNHALCHGKKRIIIAIPFTSIIVQTAQTLRDIFGEENVLEHHSVVDEEAADESSRLACENWDAPIVVTTNVQLFESMFSNRPSRCRKLHSLCNSVIILDEAQSLPLSFLQPTVDALRSYVKLFGVSVLFCTASQPLLEGDYVRGNTVHFRGIPSGTVTPIIDGSLALHDKLRRVDIAIDKEPSSYDGLAERLAGHDRVLCVVNTRRHALEIFNRLSECGDDVFHLSRMMCPAHILDTIGTIKSILEQPERSIRVVSTQLIEAGVDIDFPIVYRQLAGLDSILQAAGRCNREQKSPMGHARVFRLDNDRPFGSIGFASDSMRDLIDLAPDSDWLDPATMERFYRKLYANTPSFDSKGIAEMLGKALHCRFEEASDSYKLIDDDGVALIVNYGEAPELVERLKRYGPSMSLTRKLGRYCVGVRNYVFDKMRRDGLVEQPVAGFYYVSSPAQYDSSTGLKTDSEYLEQTFII